MSEQRPVTRLQAAVVLILIGIVLLVVIGAQQRQIDDLQSQVKTTKKNLNTLAILNCEMAYAKSDDDVMDEYLDNGRFSSGFDFDYERCTR